MRRCLRKGLDRFRQAPINIAVVLVIAFVLLFIMFLFCGCAPGQPTSAEADSGTLAPDDLQETGQSIFPQVPRYRDEPMVPFDRTGSSAAKEKGAAGPVTFPQGLPAEQQSGRSGFIPHKTESYQDLNNTPPVRLTDPGRVKSESKKLNGAIYPDEQLNSGTEDWNQRCYIFPENSADVPENCRRLGQVVAPQIFKDTGIPVTGEIRRR